MPQTEPAPLPPAPPAPVRTVRGGIAAIACLLLASVPALAMHHAPPPLHVSGSAPARILLPPARIDAPARRSGPEIALVIDDMGHDLASVRRVAALPVPLTAAFLPYVPDAASRVAIARAAGKEIFLHMPMEPESAAVDPGPMVLRVGQPADRILTLLEAALARVPGSVGINNHMGSRFTREPEPMTAVVAWAAAHGLVFLDSRTTPGSVGAALAEAHGLPHVGRDLFLDNVADPTAIRAQLERAVEHARQHGSAVAIGHPRPVTLDVLERWIPEALARGVRFTTAGALARSRQCPDGIELVAAGGAFSGCRSRSSPPPRPHG